VDKERTIAKVVNKRKIRETNTDFAYWQSLPAKDRLAALAEIRREYHAWKYD